MNIIGDFLHHIFIPREQNNYKARALHPDILTYYLVFAILLTFFVKNINSNIQNVLGFATDISVPKLYERTNMERSKNGLAPLQYNEKLAAAAQQKAEDMFTQNYWAHFAPDGKSPWNFILGAGYQYEFAGENLAKNFLFSDGVVEAWMDSPSHRENILRSDYTEVGYAIANGVLNGEETTLVVQMFGRPLNSIALNQTIRPVSAEIKPDTPTPTNIDAITPTSAQIMTVANTNPTGSVKLTQIDNTKLILGNQTPAKMNLLPFVFNTNIIFFIFLMSVISLDFYFAARIKVLHLGGKHIAHFIFLGFIIAGLFLTLVRGSIL